MGIPSRNPNTMIVGHDKWDDYCRDSFHKEQSHFSDMRVRCLLIFILLCASCSNYNTKIHEIPLASGDKLLIKHESAPGWVDPYNKITPYILWDNGKKEELPFFLHDLLPGYYLDYPPNCMKVTEKNGLIFLVTDYGAVVRKGTKDDIESHWNWRIWSLNLSYKYQDEHRKFIESYAQSKGKQSTGIPFGTYRIESIDYESKDFIYKTKDYNPNILQYLVFTGTDDLHFQFNKAKTDEILKKSYQTNILSPHNREHWELTLKLSHPTLHIYGSHLPDKMINVNFKETRFSGIAEIRSLSENEKVIRRRYNLEKYVEIEQIITAGEDEVDFHFTVKNTGDAPSKMHEIQAMVDISGFIGRSYDYGYHEKMEKRYHYLRKCLIYRDNKLMRLSEVKPWQAWYPVRSKGLIGAFSADEKLIFAMAWEPHEEFAQDPFLNLRSIVRIDSVKPGEVKNVHGKVYLVPHDVPELLTRYAKDFSEHK